MYNCVPCPRIVAIGSRIDLLGLWWDSTFFQFGRRLDPFLVEIRGLSQLSGLDRRQLSGLDRRQLGLSHANMKFSKILTYNYSLIKTRLVIFMYIRTYAFL